MGKYLKISEMSCDAIDVKPRNMIWNSDHPWEAFSVCACTGCGINVPISPGDGNCTHKEHDGTDCEGWIDLFEGPMMNHFYPLPDGMNEDTIEASKLISGVPLCIVKLSPVDSDDEWGLALTGGGMDLSWEICEAYMRLGYKPPLHFAGLPEMAGRGTSTKDKWIIRGCRWSCRIARDWAASKLTRLSRSFPTSESVEVP